MKITGDEFAQCQAGGMNARELCEGQFDGGLTIRQEFARTAMQAMMPLYWATDGEWSMEEVAEGAVQMADALIAELNKPKAI